VVVGQRDPIATTDLAGGGAGFMPCWWWCSDCGDVGVQDWGQEGHKVGFWWGDQSVGSQSVCHG
jgi:hypothetical protein